jgi:hypothetical protein
MDAQLRRRLEMAVRVRDFLRAHRTDGVAEGAALAVAGSSWTPGATSTARHEIILESRTHAARRP